MSEPAPAPEAAAQPEEKTTSAPTKPQAAPIIENKSFADVLKSLMGKVVTFVNAESFEEGGLGYTLEAGWYKAKLTGVGNDYLVLISEFKRGIGKKATKEPIKQYVPIQKIKRITIMKAQVLVHI